MTWNNSTEPVQISAGVPTVAPTATSHVRVFTSRAAMIAVRVALRLCPVNVNVLMLRVEPADVIAVEICSCSEEGRL
jgi:hypothetical protein